MCSVRGWGYIGEEIFEKENLLKKLGKKKLFLDAEARSAQLARLSPRNQPHLKWPPNAGMHLVLRRLIATIFPSKRGVS